MKKVQGFSIYELIVVFLVSGIVLSMAYWTFMRFVSFSFDFKKDKEIQYETINMISNLRKSILVSEKVIKMTNGFILKNNEESTKIWVKKDKLIYQSEVHELPFELMKYQTLFKHKEIVNNELIDEIIIKGIFVKDTLTIHFKKEYFASSFLNEKTEDF